MPRTLLIASMCLFASPLLAQRAQVSIPYVAPGNATSIAYSSGQTYQLGDIASYSGSVYLSLIYANTGNTPSLGSPYWSMLSGSGSVGATGATGTQGIQGIQGVAGATGATGAQGAPGSGANAATSGALGSVQLAPGQTSSVLSPVATTGAFGNLSGVGTTQGRVLYQKSNWSNLSDFSIDSANVTATVNGSGKIVVSGSSASLNGYLALNGTQAADEDVDLDVLLTVGSSGYGVSVGKLSANNEVWPDVAGFLALADSPADLKWLQGSGSNAVTVGSLNSVGTVAAGDVVELIYSQRGNKFSVIYYNHTQKTYASNVITSDMAPTGGAYNINAPNSSRLALWVQGGSYTIQSITAISRQPYAPNLCVFGHSYVWGFNSGTFAQRFSSQLEQYGPVAVYGGQADKMLEILGDTPYVVANHCSQVLLVGGYNDLAFGVSSSTWEPQYQQTVAALVAGGAKVFHLELPSTPNQDTSSLNAFISANYSSANIITVPSFEVSSDNTHPDGVGHSQIAADIVASGKLTTESGGSLSGVPSASVVQYPPGSFANQQSGSSGTVTASTGYQQFMLCTGTPCQVDSTSTLVYGTYSGGTVVLPTGTASSSSTTGVQRQVLVQSSDTATSGTVVTPPSGYTLYNSQGASVSSVTVPLGQVGIFSGYVNGGVEHWYEGLPMSGNSGSPSGGSIPYQHCTTSPCQMDGADSFVDGDISGQAQSLVLPTASASSGSVNDVTVRCFVFNTSCTITPPSGYSLYAVGSSTSTGSITLQPGHTARFTMFGGGGSNWLQDW